VAISARVAPQDLRQEGPPHDLGRKDVVLSEQRVAIDEGPLNDLGGQHLGKGQSGLLEERRGGERPFFLADLESAV
jgi:hypothetical protein